MVEVLERAIGFISPRWALRRTQARMAMRAYEAAGKGKRLANWRGARGSVNGENELAGQTLRERSRHLVQNDGYAARAVKTIVTNAVGTGIIAKVSEERPALLWKAWAESLVADFDGMNSFYGLQALAMRTMVESGEVLIRKVVEGGALRLQILEPEFLEAVETDGTGRPRAYRIFREHPAEASSPSSIRVPAEDIIHLFDVLRPGQRRGVPWLHGVLLDLKDLSEYEDSELMRRKVAACLSIFIQYGQGAEEREKEEYDLSKSISPGQITELPYGATMTQTSPPTVSGYEEYLRPKLRKIASGLGISYEVLAGDYSQVNFSSGRMGWIEFQRNIDHWRWLLLIPRLCNVVWRWWCEVNMVSEKVTVEWTPPRREMIDPVKETKALKEAVDACFKSVSEVIRENGDDPQVVFKEISEERKRLPKTQESKKDAA